MNLVTTIESVLDMSQPNRLIYESSPYLLQHAHNPVDWYPWGQEALDRAKKENKLILISIGYSACHWCHVMEHESFEDFAVADVMNTFFICIKVDREERPDIDQVYMSAVQLMTGRGGWPLNCFALPDGRPVYGGTYFPKNQWLNILMNLKDAFLNDRSRIEEYAAELTSGVAKMDRISIPDTELKPNRELIHESVKNWITRFDNTEGGPNRAPKFPLPNNYLFLLRYALNEKNKEVSEHVKLTLRKMAYGGICDQLGGGFSRYSVDGIWKVPHFEKMLYDNAQLISLYSEAFRAFNDPLYKQVVKQTIQFVEDELEGELNNFYSALDADLEGEEGKFYVWTKAELKQQLGDDFELFSDYFNVNNYGFWEHDSYILLRNESDEVIAARYGMDADSLFKKIESLRLFLLEIRNKRTRPGLDDKTLTSWNALMITGLLDAYDAFGEPEYLEKSVRCASFILDKLSSNDGGLYHNFKNGKSTINGYLEDYSFFIQSLIRLYQCTFEEKWIDEANRLTGYVITHFSIPDSPLFYFTSDLDPPLITRKTELQDNVIPASVSQMAINLFMLGNYFENNSWIERSRQMLSAVESEVVSYGSAYSNWLIHLLNLTEPLREMVICGTDATEVRLKMVKQSMTSGILLGGCVQKENLPMTHKRLVPDQTLIYVCIDHTCSMPVDTVEAALKLISAD